MLVFFISALYYITETFVCFSVIYSIAFFLSTLHLSFNLIVSDGVCIWSVSISLLCFATTIDALVLFILLALLFWLLFFLSVTNSFLYTLFSFFFFAFTSVHFVCYCFVRNYSKMDFNQFRIVCLCTWWNINEKPCNREVPIFFLLLLPSQFVSVAFDFFF